MTARSGQVLLSCPSSLQGHSDIPPSFAHILPVSPNLIVPTTFEARWKRWDFRSDLRCLSPHADGITSGSLQVLMPFSSLQALAFPIHRRGSACISPSASFSRYWTLPAISVQRYLTRLHHSFYTTACRFGRHPFLGTTRAFRREPSRCRVGASATWLLPPKPAPSLHTQKGSWCVHLLSDK